MSFTIQAGRIIAEGRIEGLSGRRIIGGYQLHFSVALTIHPHTAEVAPMAVSQWTAYVACATGAGGAVALAPARPELALALQTFDFVHGTHVGFLVDLSPQQLADLEDLRGEGDLRFELTISALVAQVAACGTQVRPSSTVQRDGLELTRDVLTFSMGMSDWVRVLNQMEFRRTMVFSVHFPAGPVSQSFRSAQVLLEQARNRLAQGQYEAVVSLARKIMESIAMATGESERLRLAITKYRESRQTRESMSKAERALIVQEAVRHYTHLAHHVDQADGAPEWYSRADAVFALSLATAVFSDAVERHSIDQDRDPTEGRAG